MTETALDRAVELLEGRALYDGLEIAAKRAAVVGEGIARDNLYPPTAGTKPPLPYFYVLNNRPSKFKSERQRRKVMALGAEGKIPYPRTGRLGASLTSAVDIQPTGVVITWGTNEPGAAYVIGKEEQNHYLASLDWKPLQDELETHRDEIVGEFMTTLDGYIRGYLAGR